MKNRKSILLVVLLMAVGFAAVSTILFINGSTKINANQKDFNVYYSDVLVNGVRDLSVVQSEKVLSFTTELSELGEKYVLDYDVTNGSKNYDAELAMECTGGNEYLTVTNEFDDESVLESLKTRRGKLSLELIKSYSGETSLEVTVTCTINANAIERDNLGDGSVETPVISAEYVIGEEIIIAGEKFNVIAEDKENVTMLAQYNLGIDYKQSEVENYVTFADSDGWENIPGPKEIDIFEWSTNPKIYVTEYVSFLQSELNDIDVSGNLITLKEMGNLGCTFPDDYGWIADDSARTCTVSKYFSWLINGQRWWTRSVSAVDKTHVWNVSAIDVFRGDNFKEAKRGIRPIITVSKDVLREYL